MRRPLIAGNWKMHLSLKEAIQLTDLLLTQAYLYPNIDIAIFPTFLQSTEIAKKTKNASILLGAQNCYLGEQGAFTGEISAVMLKEIGCSLILAGHSERRTLFKESDELVAQKVAEILKVGLTPILCIGETQAEREAGQTQAVNLRQLNAVINLLGIEVFSKIVIAYEPVWAIGTGITATPEQAEEVHAFIREHLAQNNIDIARTIRILYGGSMKAENAESLLAQPNIDGGLIGGASLKAESFLKICEAAHVLKLAAAS